MAPLSNTAYPSSLNESFFDDAKERFFATLRG
jgi:hypothetical protein